LRIICTTEVAADCQPLIQLLPIILRLRFNRPKRNETNADQNASHQNDENPSSAHERIVSKTAQFKNPFAVHIFAQSDIFGLYAQVKSGMGLPNSHSASIRAPLKNKRKWGGRMRAINRKLLAELREGEQLRAQNTVLATARNQ
jgi:hypothetical protein